jgi:hypothetical protein
VLVTGTGESRELGVPACSRAGQCVGMSGSFVNWVHPMNRVVRGGRSPLCFSRRHRAHTGLGAWRPAPPTRIEGRLRRAGLTHHEASRTPHVESRRGGAPSSVVRSSRVSRVRARVSTREARARYTGRGDSPRPSEARSPLTRRHYWSVRGQVLCALGEKHERQEKSAPKGLTKVAT